MCIEDKEDQVPRSSNRTEQDRNGEEESEQSIELARAKKHKKR